MRSRIQVVRWMLLGTLSLSACGGSSDAAVSGSNGGTSGGGDMGSGGSNAAGGSTDNGAGGSNAAGTTSGTGNATSGDGGSQSGAGGAQSGDGGASPGSGGAEEDGGMPKGGAAGKGGARATGGTAGKGGTAGMGGNGAGGRPATCPMRAPTNATTCTMMEEGSACTYGAEVCTCAMRAGRRDWQCMRNTGGAAGAGGMGGMGNTANCPMTAPMSGGMCTRATRPGESNTCHYGTDACTCGGTGAMSTWTCLTCPTAEPRGGSACDTAGTCDYTVMGRAAFCTCRAPVGGGRGGAGGAGMTWTCF